MDLFTDAELVRDMQKELDAVIQQGVVQITRLLRNSETGVSSGTGRALDEDDFQLSRKKHSYLRGSRSSSVGQGKLTERLLAQGLLTPNMLQELKREWNRNSAGDSDDDNDDEPKKTRRKRKIK